MADQAAIALNLFTPQKRAAFAAAIGTVVVWGLQPEGMFAMGVPRTWGPLWQEGDQIPPTRTPWWFVPVGLAFVAGGFI